MTDTTAPDQGWAFPGTAIKAHYFGPDGRALCGKWGSFGMPSAAFEPDTGPSRSDCAGCRRRLDARKPAAS